VESGNHGIFVLEVIDIKAQMASHALETGIETKNLWLVT